MKTKKPYGHMLRLRKQDAIRPARMTAKDKTIHTQELARLTDEYIANGGVIHKGHDCPIEPKYEHYKANGKGAFA